METERFLADLVARLDEVKRVHRKECRRFFSELAPRLNTARALERQLDQKLACRFNVFDYLKTDELGLSRIIADLLDPEASHGQGRLFLRKFIESLEGLNGKPHWPDLDETPISVTCEQTIRDERRMDVVVEFRGPDEKSYCLAIENKPYAGDLEEQLKDYLEHLEREYGERFLLIYLSPTGEGPSETSIRRTELDEKWKGRFAIMAYCRGREESADEFDSCRLQDSLVDWFGECRESCEVDRLSWFLRDAEVFCQRTFGGLAMTTDGETRAVRDYVLSNPSNMTTAMAVYEAWPHVKEHVCKEFMKHLCSRIEMAEELRRSAPDRRIGWQYDSDSKPDPMRFYGYPAIWLYRDSWAHYEEATRSITGGRTAILLQADRNEPTGWFIGVRNPVPVETMTYSQRERRRHLEDKLKAKLGGNKDSDERWPWCVYVDEDKRDWKPLVPDLDRECKSTKDDGITKYFVDKFTEIAVKAIPIIDEVEGKVPLRRRDFKPIRIQGGMISDTVLDDRR